MAKRIEVTLLPVDVVNLGAVARGIALRRVLEEGKRLTATVHRYLGKGARKITVAQGRHLVKAASRLQASVSVYEAAS